MITSFLDEPGGAPKEVGGMLTCTTCCRKRRNVVGSWGNLLVVCSHYLKLSIDRWLDSVLFTRSLIEKPETEGPSGQQNRQCGLKEVYVWFI